jgi:hypothetical protein
LLSNNDFSSAIKAYNGYNIEDWNMKSLIIIITALILFGSQMCISYKHKKTCKGTSNKDV